MTLLSTTSWMLPWGLTIERPLWLLALFPGVLLIRAYLRNRARAERWQRLIAPHLLGHLLRTERREGGFTPARLALATLLVWVLALAGPGWQGLGAGTGGKPDPLVILLSLSPSMNDKVLAPSRLAQAKLKLRDLLERRQGAQTALVVFAGSAHTVLPMTADSDTLAWYLQELTTDVMPEAGWDAVEAMALGRKLAADPRAGLLLVSEPVVPDSGLSSAVEQLDRRLAVLLLNTVEERPDAVRMLDPLQAFGRVTVEPMSLDNGDLARIERFFMRLGMSSATGANGQPGFDLGYWMLYPLALLLLLWFRRGMVMRWL